MTGDVKRKSWFTAFYCFADGIRELTDGGVNYKVLYSLVGTRGEYVNHENSAIRVSSAPALSRLIHSSRYADDLARRYEDDPFAFSQAAELLCNMIFNTCDKSPTELLSYLGGPLWESVEAGFENERQGGRGGLNMHRIHLEMSSMFAHCSILVDEHPVRYLRLALECYFQVLAFRCLDESVVRLFIDPTPLDFIDTQPDFQEPAGSACLVKLLEHDVIGGVWRVKDGTMSIGRYTDCDVIETDDYISRRHCEIVCDGGECLFKDCGSVHGSLVVRDGKTVYDSLAPQRAEPVRLEHGDRIVLARRSSYQLAVLREPTIAQIEAEFPMYS